MNELDSLLLFVDLYCVEEKHRKNYKPVHNEDERLVQAATDELGAGVT